MKETLQIPEGMEFSHVDSDGIIHLKEKKPKYPTTVQDLDLDEAYYIETNGDVEKGPVANEESNIFLDEATAKAMSAFMFLVTMCQAWNKIDGYKPVFDGDKSKYCIVVSDGTIRTDTFWSNNHVLAFKDQETADKFLETFKDKIKEAKSLL